MPPTMMDDPNPEWNWNTNFQDLLNKKLKQVEQEKNSEELQTLPKTEKEWIELIYNLTDAADLRKVAELLVKQNFVYRKMVDDNFKKGL